MTASIKLLAVLGLVLMFGGLYLLIDGAYGIHLGLGQGLVGLVSMSLGNWAIRHALESAKAPGVDAGAKT